MYKKNLLIFLIILSGFVLNMLSVQIVGSSFRYLQGELNASVEQISYIMSASLIAEVIIIPFSGWLARLLSHRVLFLISLSGFLLASLGCGFANNLFIMIIFRGLQGFFGGAMLPLMVANIYILFKPKDVPLILSIAATVGVSSIALGPILGGFLTEFLNWRWMFLYNIPIGLFIFFLAYIKVDLYEKEKNLIDKIDFPGILFLAISLIALLIFIEEGERRDWFDSNFILLCFSIFTISIIMFFNREFNTKYPIIDLKIFSDMNFLIGCICCIIFAITLYVPIFLLPIILSEMRLIGPIDIGIIISTMGLGMMVSGPIVGKTLKNLGVKVVILIGCAITGIGTYLQSIITAEYIFNDFLLSQILKGVGTQFLFMGSQYICFINLPTNKINNAAAMFNLTLRLSAAISIAISSNFFTKWKHVFFQQITAETNFLSSPYFQNFKFNKFEENLNSFTSNLYAFSEREALIISFNKISYYSTWTVLIPAVLIIFIKKANK